MSKGGSEVEEKERVIRAHLKKVRVIQENFCPKKERVGSQATSAQVCQQCNELKRKMN